MQQVVFFINNAMPTKLMLVQSLVVACTFCVVAFITPAFEFSGRTLLDNRFAA
jgi:hypothetical protein